MAEGSWIRIGAVKANLDARTVNALVKETLGRKAVSITQRPEVRQQIGEALVDAVNERVPMKSGALRDSGRATTDGRVYWSAVNKGYNYAHNVYDPEGERWPDGHYAKPSTPNTFPRWIDHIQPGTPEYDAFINNARQIIIEAAQKGLL